LSSGYKTKAEMINWRRNKIIELKAQGLDQTEIARFLQVSPATITYDLKYMRKEAMQNVREYTTNELPLQYKIFKEALQNAIQTYWRLSQEAKMTMTKSQL
jgi:transcriptional regulator